MNIDIYLKAEELVNNGVYGEAIKLLISILDEDPTEKYAIERLKELSKNLSKEIEVISKIISENDKALEKIEQERIKIFQQEIKDKKGYIHAIITAKKALEKSEIPRVIEAVKGYLDCIDSSDKEEVKELVLETLKSCIDNNESSYLSNLLNCIPENSSFLNIHEGIINKAKLIVCWFSGNWTNARLI